MKGEIVSHYRILAKLGEGGMGVVYEARDLKLDRTVALKFLSRERTSDPQAKERFVREARAAAQLDHPNVCTIYEIDEVEDGRLFISMARCAGETLGSILQGPSLPLDRALRIALGIARGLGHAHQHRLIHRDIKPANVMVADSGEIKILDFGIAKQLDATTLTSTDKAVGTVLYMSPERFHGREVDHRADIWSLGVVLYQMVFGRLPFVADSLPSLFNEVCNTPVRFPPDIPGIPRELHELIARCLRKDPEDRYQGADDLADDLVRLLGTPETGQIPRRPATVTQSLRRTRIRLIWGIAGVAMAVLILVLSGVLTPKGPSPASDAVAHKLAVLRFANLTDAADAGRLGQIIQELLITDLTESPSLLLLSSQQIFDTQKRLGYTEAPEIDESRAIEVTRNAGATVMLTGSIFNNRPGFVLSGQLIDLSTGAVLKSQRIQGSDLLTLVDDLSLQIREDLGLVPTPEDRAEVSVQAKVSGSLDAIRHYLAGVELLNASSLRRAIDEFKKAVEIDPGFTQAYFKLAMAQWWSDDVAADHGRASIIRLLNGPGYLTKHDRLFAEGALALIDRHFTDAIETFEKLSVTYPNDKEVYFVLGMAYMLEVDALWLDKALDAFNKAKQLDPEFVLAYSNICEIYLYRRECDKIEETAETLVSIRPDSPIGYRHLADAAICRGDSTAATEAIATALVHHTTARDRQLLYYHIGSAYNRVRDHRSSEKYSRLALAEDPQSADDRIWAQLGDALYNQRRLEEARQSWEKGLELNPSSSWCLGGMWYVALDEGDYDHAIDYARRLVETRPQSPRRYGELFESLIYSRRPAEAESSLIAGLASIPSSDGKMDLLRRAANVYRLRNRLNDADRLLREAASLSPSEDLAGIYVERAQIANSRRAYEEARRLAEQALQADPKQETARRALFFARLYGGKVEEAVAMACQGLENRPADPEVYGDLVEAYIVAGKYGEADSLVARVGHRGFSVVTISEVLTRLATCYRRAGKFSEAVELYSTSVEWLPGARNARRSIGLVRELEGRYSEATQVYTSILHDSPDDVRALQSLGRAYYRQGRLEQAEKYYRQALGGDRGDPQALRELACLLLEDGRATEARKLAERAVVEEPTCVSDAALAWILVEKDLDLERGIGLAQTAMREPPPDDPTDEWIRIVPFVPLPEHVLGLAHLRRKEFEAARVYLEKASAIRPECPRIAQDLEALLRAVGESATSSAQ